MITYIINKLAPSSTHFIRGLTKIVPYRGWFRAVASQNGDKFATSSTLPIAGRPVWERKSNIYLSMVMQTQHALLETTVRTPSPVPADSWQ